MKKGAVIAIIVIIIIAVLIWWWLAYPTSSGNPNILQPYPTSTPVSGTTGMGGGPMLPVFDQTISNGTITLNYPSRDFALATSQNQILVNSVVPPCGSNFNYCLYYNNSSTYAGTNFESAGIRIQKRVTLTTQSQCLNTQPSGYTNLTPLIATSSDYAVSEFANVGEGAAGSTSSGALYRLYYAPTASCYEFETRIGQSEFGNYPSGTIQEFNAGDQASLQEELQAILGTLTIASSGEPIVFPSQGSQIIQ